jgi:hypothetical protein
MITRTRIALVLATVMVAIIQFPSSTHAQTSSTDVRSQAREHFDRGIELFNEGRYDAALAELWRAYDIAPAFPVLYNLGRVHAILGHPVEAARAFERYLAEGGDAIPAARRDEVETELSRQRSRIGRLVVETNIAGSIINIDGIDIARTPLEAPIPLGAGAHTIAVRAPGHASEIRSVQIAGGVEETIRATLSREFEARGTVRIDSSLPDVLVRIDGLEIGRTPIEATIPLPAGEHEIAGERDGYLSDVHRITIQDQASAEVRLRLDPDPNPPSESVGRLVLRLPSVSFALRVDGAERTARSELELPVGAHMIEIEAAERQPWRGAVRLTAEHSETLTPPLEWTPNARSRRVGAAESQRLAGQVLSVIGTVLIAVGVPLTIWNESEIVNTDARGRQLAQEWADCRNAGGGSARCEEVGNELRGISSAQDTQDILRVVSFASAITGVLSATIGIVLWASAPSESSIDDAAHATLRLDLRGLHLSGAF